MTGNPVSAGQIMNLLLGLVIVILVFLGVVFLLKRLSGFNGVGRGYMKLIDTLPVSTRERLLLVKVVDTYMVLGVSPGRINTLHVLADGIPDETTAQSGDFRAQMNKWLPGKQDKQT